MLTSAHWIVPMPVLRKSPWAGAGSDVGAVGGANVHTALITAAAAVAAAGIAAAVIIETEGEARLGSQRYTPMATRHSVPTMAV